MSTRKTRPMASSNSVLLYDTTLRDGSQRKGLSFSLEDKLKIARLLDSFGVHYLEGGWPGSNPKDMEFFQRLQNQPLKNSTLVAFGSTCRVGTRAEDDANLKALLQANTEAVTLVGKSSTFHVRNVLQTDLQENLRLIRESLALMKENGKEVIYDAEHFFDGFRLDADYALLTLKTALEAGADWLVLCDTNGGTMPDYVAGVVEDVISEFGCKVGIHAHNDCELAVANTLSAVQAGARQVQGTINGYGERCGNANLISLVPSMQLKLGFNCVPAKNLAGLTELSHRLSEIANLNPDACAAYVGSSAFAHKAGLHVAAVERVSASYEHIDPELVGNCRQIVVSELSGRGNIRMLATDLGLSLSGREQSVLDEVKKLEEQGFQFENAEGTVELMIRRKFAAYKAPFELVDMMVFVSDSAQSGMSAQAVVKVRVDNVVFHTASEGKGPVHALDLALRKALAHSYPCLDEVRLADYKVRILEPDLATEATTRVVVEAASAEQRWSTVGCSGNIIEASYQALADSLELYLLRLQEKYENVVTPASALQQVS